MIKIVRFFDSFEDRTRRRLSKYPIVYAFIGAVGMLLFWRGVWMIADITPIISDPYVSLLVSVVILLASGLFVSIFVGDSIILSGVMGEKKLIEKTEAELQKEGSELSAIKIEVGKEEEMLTQIQIELRELRRIVEGLKK